MAKTPKRGSSSTRVGKVAARFLLLALVGALAVSAAAARPAEVIVLPGATSAEGIAAGRGKTFYAGDLFAGDIFRGDMQHGTAELFIDAPAGRQGCRHGRRSRARVAVRRRWLHRPEGYVYDTGTGTTVAKCQFATPPATVINDVALTKDGAWFALIRFRPSSTSCPSARPACQGRSARWRSAVLRPTPAGSSTSTASQATSNGKTLIVAHSANGELYTVDPATGASARIAGVSVPNVYGIVLDGTRLWAVQGFANQVSLVCLSPHLTSGVVEEVITSTFFQVPATAARFGSRLAVVNAKFDTGFPPIADQYEVVLVDA